MTRRARRRLGIGAGVSTARAWLALLLVAGSVVFAVAGCTGPGLDPPEADATDIAPGTPNANASGGTTAPRASGSGGQASGNGGSMGTAAGGAGGKSADGMGSGGSPGLDHDAGVADAGAPDAGSIDEDGGATH